MSKRIFINNLNTYVSQAIFAELRNDVGEDGEKNPDANVIFGTYIDRDSSIKPDGVKKMLKVTFIIKTVEILNFILAFKTTFDNEISLRMRSACF
jgi:hypothetical protein